MPRVGNLHTQVVNELGRAIVSGRLAAGTVLPSEAELAAEMGVSRTVTREALKSLAARGMVMARPRAGTRILASDRWSGLDPDIIRWRLTGDDRLERLRELLELRLLVEPAAAGLTAERADADRRQAIWRAFESIAAAREDPETWIEAAAEMHALILGGCGNELLASIGRLLRAAILESRHVARPALDELPPELAAPHASPGDEAWARDESIAAAIRDGDAGASEREMRGLLQRVAELYDYLIDRAATAGAPG